MGGVDRHWHLVAHFTFKQKGGDFVPSVIDSLRLGDELTTLVAYSRWCPRRAFAQ